MSESIVSVDSDDECQFASGMTVLARDEEWLVTEVSRTPDGSRLVVTGTSPLVRDQPAVFFHHPRALDTVTPLRAEDTQLIHDTSPGFRRSRLFIEALLRKTPLPQGERRLATAGTHLADDLLYQREPANRAFANLRPRLLIADAVGLGKTLEIGLLLSELIRRGRGDRILVVTPRHILEQFQHELWTRFAIGLVGLDSTGVARMQRKLPAGRNPFDYYQRVIASIDTLKSARYRDQLRRVQWDAVVMDESHKLISKTALNNQLARVLAPTTHAFILASATPHNGDDESFNELISLIDPTAIVDVKKRATRDQLQRLYVRRHKMTPDVAAQLGAEWAERAKPQFVDCRATPAEEAVLDELYATWIAPPVAKSPPVTGKGSRLFPVTLLKAFLSSHKALLETVEGRLKRGEGNPARAQEIAALQRLADLAGRVTDDDSAKLAALVEVLVDKIGIGPKSPTRVVIFSERRKTIDWLHRQLSARLGFEQQDAAPQGQKGVTGPVRVLHGGQADEDQQRIVKDFALESSDVRILLTSDIAAEGVNLHRQCHQLVHYDIPWSLITIEQRNGRIDRYGQRVSPQIRVMLQRSANPKHEADESVSKVLANKEDSAHRTLGEAAALMGLRDEDAEQMSVEEAFLAGRDINEVVPDEPTDDDDIFMAGGGFDEDQTVGEEQGRPDDTVRPPRLFGSTREFVEDAFAEAFPNPAEAIGLTWLDAADYPDTFEFDLNRDGHRLADLQRRLKVLPQAYLDERRVLEQMTLTFSAEVATNRLELARKHSGNRAKRRGPATREQKYAESGWPDISYLTDQHPVIEWLVDKVLARRSADTTHARRLTAPVIAANVTDPVFLVNGRYSNRQGKPTVLAWLALHHRADGMQVDGREFVQVLHDAKVNRAMRMSPIGDLPALELLIPKAVEVARVEMAERRRAEEDKLMAPLVAYSEQLRRWEAATGARYEQLTLTAVRSREEQRVRHTATKVRQLIDELTTDGEPMIRVVGVLVPERSV
ncbi:helicase-related protein [Micromonospora sp. 4G57]|uniref:Helicase-related protein n=1 Tax=Micromonospora sicca TaxID=2202420 RepID=A0ABU5JKW5_9ACTN|nr:MULTISPECIES: helicase-related protein [unclassified Micromonospora]MDZ5447074.1 helicase-related protein [Micromonospora sp. 4G57]MDZ5493049.1 helicase-related protein [Micromonospora sp. 4G53]